MDTVRLHFTDISRNSIGGLLKWISECFQIEFVEDDPDFIIHSCAGREVLKYDGVRIAWLGENIQPDFNLSDYAMGFGRITFQDRYKRIPLYRWYSAHYEDLFDDSRNVIKINGEQELLGKKLFCTMVVSNGSRGDYFDQMIEAITQYKSIDSGGKWNNNTGGPVDQKLPFINQGKFHLAFENSSTPGYITEKILHAFVTHTVPIYWGAPDVAEDFNPKAFINCHEYGSVNEVVERIKQLDHDDAAYIAMLEEPPFVDGKEPEGLSKKEIMAWVSHIFAQPRSQAYRRNRVFWGGQYEHQLRTVFFRPHVQLAKLALQKFRRLLGSFKTS